VNGEQRGATPVLIRPAAPGELGAIHELVGDAYRGYISEIGFRAPPMDVDYGAALARGEVFVAEDESIVGVIVLVGHPQNLLVENVAVHPREQGKGIGSALLDFAERRARTKGLPRVRLYTHERMARNLLIYARRGYRRDRKPPGDDSPRVFLSKEV
jgi:GNAT superfamily N-acetyltransferase